MSRLAILFMSCILVIAFQNCAPGFKAQGLLTQESQTGSGAAAGPTPPLVTVIKKLVTIGVGVGGMRLAGVDDFSQLYSGFQDASNALTKQIITDPSNPNLFTCPATTTLMAYIYGNACCFSQFQCVSNSWHSDYFFRAIAFGNGRFVAVGGWLYGISRTTTDGKTWSSKSDLMDGSGNVTGALTSATWMTSVVFGGNRFVGLDGDCHLYESSDGLRWTVGSTQIIMKDVHCRHLYAVPGGFYASGDTGLWGFSTDGKTWISSGAGVNPIEVRKVANDYYGISSGTVYKLVDAKTDQWQSVFTRADGNSLVYNPVDGSLNMFGYGFIVKANAPFTTWNATAMQGPGQSVIHNGVVFIGQGSGSIESSVDGINWNTYVYPTNFDQPILEFASAEVAP